jgi:hypothetical protein
MKRLVAVYGLLMLGGGCGNDGIDEHIGAPCVDNHDCTDRCYTSPRYPGGFCSHTCDSDLDCPVNTHCISGDMGVCLFACPPLDCADLGPGWSCQQQPLEGMGTAAVCVGT